MMADHPHPHGAKDPETCGHYVAACRLCGRAWCRDCGKEWAPDVPRGREYDWSQGHWVQTPEDVEWDNAPLVEGTD